MSEANHQRLQHLRNALLHLHKTLVDSERISYEKTVGAIQSPNHFLSLLMNDPWFAWLQPISQIIVAMDEALEAKEPLTPANIETLINQTRQLLVATEDGEGFSRHYFDALQSDLTSSSPTPKPPNSSPAPNPQNNLPRQTEMVFLLTAALLSSRSIQTQT